MFELLIRNISKRGIDLTQEEISILQSKFTHKHFRKHQYILQQGEFSRVENFIVDGLTRTYEVDEKGQEHILQFGMEDWWIGDMYSFLSGKPSAFNIDCLEDTEVLQITKPNLDQLYSEVPKMNQYFRLLLEKALITTNQRIIASLRKTAAERYLEFLEKYPRIDQRVSNHQIASFLGITPQSLSRVRRDLSK